MKRNLLFAALLFAGLGIQAQNVQLHYDLGHSLYNDLGSRPNFTSTFEMFRADKFGSTYTFTDIDYFSDGSAGAYWEFDREINLTKNKQWAAHFEYDGGATSIEHTSIASRFRHALLIGGAWNWHSADFNRTFSFQTMWKYYFKGMSQGAYNGVQFTTVWGVNFAGGLCTTSGFADCWYDPDVNGKWIFLSEPQFWVNLNKIKGWDDIKLSVGTEVELSNNFVFNNEGRNNKFYAIPTLAIKWTF